jgi:hypothetical protein
MAPGVLLGKLVILLQVNALAVIAPLVKRVTLTVTALVALVPMVLNLMQTVSAEAVNRVPMDLNLIR